MWCIPETQLVMLIGMFFTNWRRDWVYPGFVSPSFIPEIGGHGSNYRFSDEPRPASSLFSAVLSTNRRFSYAYATRVIEFIYVRVACNLVWSELRLSTATALTWSLTAPPLALSLCAGTFGVHEYQHNQRIARYICDSFLIRLPHYYIRIWCGVLLE